MLTWNFLKKLMTRLVTWMDGSLFPIDLINNYETFKAMRLINGIVYMLKLMSQDVEWRKTSKQPYLIFMSRCFLHKSFYL